jgi:hypothetical protein
MKWAPRKAPGTEANEDHHQHNKPSFGSRQAHGIRRAIACSCRACLAHTVRRAVHQYHEGRPAVAGLMLYRVAQALEHDMPPVCRRFICESPRLAAGCRA